MPKRPDIKSVLVLGAGPIVIGQASEFDYSGTQACKALKSDGYRVILVNSNPATIMTDPGIADATYIEPLTPAIVAMIIRKELPNAILASVGGQTALNVAIDLFSSGVLDKYKTELIGANADSIRKAEDREKFAHLVASLGLRCPRHKIVIDHKSAVDALKHIGLPAVVRPSYTLGGFGGGIAETEDGYFKLVDEGMRCSPSHQVQVDESLVGWKEFELEMVSDKNGNCIVVCAIENVDSMGVHTGDSITVAPILTLRDREYQLMRDFAVKIMLAIGINTGGANIQFAIKDDELVVIEMNPRVSRSSALASKATGFPIAKVSSRLAVGYTMEEIPNDCVNGLSASFEPSIDYIVTKVPRFDFEKFSFYNPLLNTQMQSVGEVMAIGRCFAESLQKALSSLGNGTEGLSPIFSEPSNSIEKIREMISVNHPKKILLTGDAIRAGMDPAEVSALTKYDPWFVDRIREIIEIQNLITSDGLTPDILFEAKRLGTTDVCIAALMGWKDFRKVTAMRKKLNITPVFKRVDSCAGEFSCTTQYLYSCYEGSLYQAAECEARPSKRDKVIVIGSGPNQIGQGVEFDYACVHALAAIRANGLESIMLNCNPETVSTDYDVSDKLYFTPLTEEQVMEVIERESSVGHLLGVIVQLGGQTPIRLAKHLIDNGVKILGTSYESVDKTEDREKFQAFANSLGLKQPLSTICSDLSGLHKACQEVGFPVLVRPSYVLGGRAMQIICDDAELDLYIKTKGHLVGENVILVDQFLDGAKEVDVDALSDGETVYIAGIMEHIELAGIHSGDSACSLPPRTLSPQLIEAIERQTVLMAKHLKVVGFINIQYAVKEDNIYVIEVNLRASRTVPFVSKAIGYPIAHIATELILKLKPLRDYGLEGWRTRTQGWFSVKESVFPFNRFPNTDVLLGPEMQSTGEVMGIDVNFARAFAKSQIASGNILPTSGTIFVSVRNEDKGNTLVQIVSSLLQIGFSVIATPGTANFLQLHKLDSVVSVPKVGSGKPDIVDYLEEGKVHLVVNTTSGTQSIKDSKQIRLTSLMMKIPYYTTIDGAAAVTLAIKELGLISVRPIQRVS